MREVDAELAAMIHDLTFLTTVKGIFRSGDALGPQVVFLYSGRLGPQPAAIDVTLTESDSTIVPVIWPRFDDVGHSLPLYTAGALPWIRRLADGR